MNNSLPVVSVIIQKTEDGQRFVYIQKRWKPHINPAYAGLWEIPAGGIEAYENVFDALRREVEEECGLKITKIRDEEKLFSIDSGEDNRTITFRPFICQQALKTDNGLPWIGFVFICEATGEPQTDGVEAIEPRWIKLEELKDMLAVSPEKFFPLQLPVLIEYINSVK